MKELYIKHLYSLRYFCIAIATISLTSSAVSCDIVNNWMLSEIPNKHEFNYKLSEYGLFQEDISDLKPAEGVYPFELTTQLFTDYASKQRLFKIPKGKKIRVNQDGTFSYPDSSLIAKTFYYPITENSPISDQRIIETRLLYKINNRWNVAVYEWNRDQTDAYLINNGTEKNVSWNTEKGRLQSTRYRIPSLAECTTCHQSNSKVIPIGSKIANMDHTVLHISGEVEQLNWLKSVGILDMHDTSHIQRFPKWRDAEAPLDLRARAYFDVNCAHCHSKSGVAGHTSLFLGYELIFSKTGIKSKNKQIRHRMSSQWRGEKMPLLGTTVIHDEGVELIKTYLNNL